MKDGEVVSMTEEGGREVVRRMDRNEGEEARREVERKEGER
jgi:hypothetical protein